MDGKGGTVVFLDIDGMLNGMGWLEGCRERKRGEGVPLWDSSRLLDRGCLFRAGLLCRITHARVVMSSSWRYGWNDDGTVDTSRGGHDESRADALMRRYGICISGRTCSKVRNPGAGHVLDEAMVGEHLSRPVPEGLEMDRDSYLAYARGSQILDWIDSHGFTGRFIILDDDTGDIAIYPELRSHIVKTSFYGRHWGFRLRHLMQALFRLRAAG